MKLRLIESISNKSDDLAFLLNERIARSDEHDVLEEPAAIGKPSPSIFCATPS